MRRPQLGEGPKQYLKYIGQSVGDDFYSGVIEPAAKLANKAVGHTTSVASDGYKTYQDLQTPGLSTKDKAARGLEGLMRVGAGDVGGIAGAAVGSLGGPVGGAAGLAADSLLGSKAPNYIRDKVDPSFRFPSERIQSQNPRQSGIIK